MPDKFSETFPEVQITGGNLFEYWSYARKEEAEFGFGWEGGGVNDIISYRSKYFINPVENRVKQWHAILLFLLSGYVKTSSRKMKTHRILLFRVKVSNKRTFFYFFLPRQHFGDHHPKYADTLIDYGFYLLNVDSIRLSVQVYKASSAHFWDLLLIRRSLR